MKRVPGERLLNDEIFIRLRAARLEILLVAVVAGAFVFGVASQVQAALAGAFDTVTSAIHYVSGG